MPSDPVILLEFNELTPSLIDRFIGEGELPHFSRFRDESRAFITEAEEREPFLEPWIQWVTVHSGLPYRGHGVFHLDEGHKVTADRVWDIVAERGGTALVCGSMNPGIKHRQRTILLPDPWCTKIPPTPDELAPYFSFVRQQVLEHTNDSVPLTLKDYVRFLTFMITHGLSVRTVMAILRQLAAERRSACRWKRVVLLDRLQFDVFVHYHERFRPAFATFFLNSTAYYQHAYWDSMEPEAFGRSHDMPDVQEHRDAILFGYKQMDRLLGEFVRRFEGRATLVFCTALSQQAWVAHKQEGGGAFYRPKDIAQFARLLGMAKDCRVAPVMTEQFHIEFRNATAASQAEQRLTALEMEGSRLLFVRRDGTRILAGCQLHGDVDTNAEFVVDGGRYRFFDIFYTVPTAKSGMHHPDGLFWVRLPDRQGVDCGRAPLTAVAPTVLSLLGLSAPAHMATAPLALDLVQARPMAIGE